MVHFRMLPGVRRQDDDLGHGGSDEEVPEGGGVDFRGGSEYRLGEDSSTSTGQIYCSGGENGGAGIYFGVIPYDIVQMVQGQADMGDGSAKEGDEVPDGLHSGIQLPDFPERDRQGSKAQL